MSADSVHTGKTWSRPNPELAQALRRRIVCCCSPLGLLTSFGVTFAALTAIVLAINAGVTMQHKEFCDTSIPIKEAARRMQPNIPIDRASIEALVKDGWNRQCESVVNRSTVEAEFGPLLRDSSGFLDGDFAKVAWTTVRITGWELVRYGPRAAYVKNIVRSFQVQFINTPLWFREQDGPSSVHYWFCGYLSPTRRVVLAGANNALVEQEFHGFGTQADEWAYQYDITSKEYGRCRLSLKNTDNIDYGGGSRCAVFSLIHDRFFRFPSIRYRAPAFWLIVALAVGNVLAHWPSALDPHATLVHYPANGLTAMLPEELARASRAVRVASVAAVLSALMWLAAAVSSFTPLAVVCVALGSLLGQALPLWPLVRPKLFQRSAPRAAAQPALRSQAAPAANTPAIVAYGPPRVWLFALNAGCSALLLLSVPLLTWGPAPGGHELRFPALVFVGVLGGLALAADSIHAWRTPEAAIAARWPGMLAAAPKAEPSARSGGVFSLVGGGAQRAHAAEDGSGFVRALLELHLSVESGLLAGAGLLTAAWAYQAADYFWLSAIAAGWLAFYALDAFDRHDNAALLGSDPAAALAQLVWALAGAGALAMAAAVAAFERFSPDTTMMAAATIAALGVAAHFVAGRWHHAPSPAAAAALS